MIIKYMHDLKTDERCVLIADKAFYRDNFMATPATIRENNLDDLTAIKIENYLNYRGPDLSIDGQPIE